MCERGAYDLSNEAEEISWQERRMAELRLKKELEELYDDGAHRPGPDA